MNNTFNINRFGKVLAKDASDYFPKFGWYLLILLLVPVLIWIVGFLDLGNSIGVIFRKESILKFVMFAGILVPARLYRHANDPKKGMSYALTPASSLEKFLSMVIFCMIITPIVFLFGSIIVDTILVIIPNSTFSGYIWEGFERTVFSDYLTSNLMTINPDASFLQESLDGSLSRMFSIGTMYLNFVSFVSIFMFGNMLFKKHKTTKVFGILIIVYFLLMIVIGIRIFHYYGGNQFFFENMSDLEREEYIVSTMTKYINIHYIINTLIIVVMLAGTYLKIKTQKY